MRTGVAGARRGLGRSDHQEDIDEDRADHGLVGHLSLDGALDLAKDHGLSSVEIATGNWSEAPHADLPALVSSADARAEFAEKISSRGLALSALCANGNQLHPTEGAQHDQVVRDTIEVASHLAVPTVVLMSGLPGARGDSTPN